MSRGRGDRAKQADTILKSLEQTTLNEGPINIIETGASQNWDDGMMGILFAKIAQRTGGKMWVVDIDPNILERARIKFGEYGLDFVEFHLGDSVQFLQDFNDRVDMIHLDSWDLNLEDYFPSALHGWREFEAIKDKVDTGTIIIVDDNYLDGSWVNWYEIVDGEYTGEYKKIDITQPCVGKGSHIFWWTQQPNTDWNLLGREHMFAGDNVKIICQKGQNNPL